MSDIRKWFMKQHNKGDSNASNKAKLEIPPKSPLPAPKPQQDSCAQDGARQTKTSKHFAASDSVPIKEEKISSKRKPHKVDEDILSDSKRPSAKKMHIVEDDNDNDDDFVMPASKKGLFEAKTAKKSKNRSSKYSKDIEEDDEDGEDVEENATIKTVSSAAKPGGRGRGRGSGAAPGGGRGRGGFMNFGERKDPPHKGEKEVPEGASDCLSGLTFVISGTLDSLEREEAEDLIKRHGGRVTGSVSKKTNFLLVDEDIGGRKSQKAKELGTSFLTEDGLFDMIRKSKPVKASVPGTSDQNSSVVKSSSVKIDSKVARVSHASASRDSTKSRAAGVSYSPSKRKGEISGTISKTWTEKYKPKVSNDIIGNQTLVKQIHDWLAHWNEQFLNIEKKGKRKRESDSAAKKAVLISGPPGIGKTTSAKLVSQMLGFQAIEVNASDSRGKADSKIIKGIGGSTSNSIKELVSNESLDLSKDWSKHPKTVLIMDEVDGMSAGDRGGITDLIASIKISKIPVICICNDRYSQKLKSLINYCQLLNYRKPTKQQVAKRLMQIANAEGIQVNEIAMEELADRVKGDIRMAINQLQYISLSKSVILYDDIRERLLNSSKDEDISPFTAVDKLFGYDSGKLRMDERVDFCMSDPDLVPLIIQENYLNYRPVLVGKDDSGVRRMKLIARAAESICNGDIANVQIRRYQQWQLSQSSSLSSCIIPASLLHGSREVLEQGERNFNRFGGWLGKNSTIGKNLRLLQDLHVHILSCQESNLDRDILRIDYFSLLLKQLTDPLRSQSKEAAVRSVVQLMEVYSLSQEDFDTIVELSKFQGHPSPLERVQPAVKAALTKAYKQASSTRPVRAGAADLINLPGLKKAPKKRIAAILEPLGSDSPKENGDALSEVEENTSDTDDADGGGGEMKLELASNANSGIQVQLDLKNSGSSNVKKAPPGRSRGPGSAVKGGGGSGSRGSGPVEKKRRGLDGGAKRKK